MALVLVALLASLAPLALPWFGAGELALEGGHSAAWVLLPWIALAGLPRRSSAVTATWALALVLPLLALGVASDLRAEASAADVARVAVVQVLLALLLADSARRARGTAPHAWGWLVLVPGAAALELAAGIAGWDGVRSLARATPLVWCARTAAGAVDVAPWGAFAVGLALSALASRAGTVEA